MSAAKKATRRHKAQSPAPPKGRVESFLAPAASAKFKAVQLSEGPLTADPRPLLRFMLLILAQDSEQLFAKLVDNDAAESFLDLAEGLSSHGKWLAQAGEFCEKASFRLMAVLARYAIEHPDWSGATKRFIRHVRRRGDVATGAEKPS